MSFLFENLRAYQQSLLFAEQMQQIPTKRKTGVGSLMDQLIRASMSIPTNLAEGSGRFHANEKKQFYRIARGSTNECVPLLRLASRQGLLTTADYLRWCCTLDVIGKMITNLIKAVDKKSTADGVNGQ